MKRWLIPLLVASGSVIAAPLDMRSFETVDHDRNGYVDMVEVAGSIPLQERWYDIDVDRDGRMSAAEMQAWLDRADKSSLLSVSAPLSPHEQLRAMEERQREREAARVQRILNDEDPDGSNTTSGTGPR